MTTPTLVADGLAGDSTDFLKCVNDPSGATRIISGSATVASGTAANAYIGLIPFQANATIKLDNASVYCGNFGAGTTTVNVGIIYDDDATYTNDPDAWASASTAPQSGGFVTVDEIEGLTLKTEANGYLAVQILTAAADAEADIKFSALVSYGA